MNITSNIYHKLKQNCFNLKRMNTRIFYCVCVCVCVKKIRGSLLSWLDHLHSSVPLLYTIFYVWIENKIMKIHICNCYFACMVHLLRTQNSQMTTLTKRKKKRKASLKELWCDKIAVKVNVDVEDCLRDSQLNCIEL